MCARGMTTGGPDQPGAPMASACTASHTKSRAPAPGCELTHLALFWAPGMTCPPALHGNGVTKADICTSSMVHTRMQE